VPTRKRGQRERFDPRACFYAKKLMAVRRISARGAKARFGQDDRSRNEGGKGMGLFICGKGYGMWSSVKLSRAALTGRGSAMKMVLVRDAGVHGSD
jgi:hypothetical protein